MSRPSAQKSMKILQQFEECSYTRNLGIRIVHNKFFKQGMSYCKTGLEQVKRISYQLHGRRYSLELFRTLKKILQKRTNLAKVFARVRNLRQSERLKRVGSTDAFLASVERRRASKRRSR